MKKLVNLKTLSMVICTFFAVATVFTACGQKADDKSSGTPTSSAKTSEAPKLKGTVTVVGSTSVQPLAQELADAFTKKESGVKIDIQGVGSGAGIKAAIDGTSDLGSSSRDLEGDEKTKGLKDVTIALDGIAVIVNPKNGVADLTTEQVGKIFKGEIKNWKEIGGIDKEILIVSREAGSGTRTAFEELLKLQKKEGDKTVSLVKADALIAEGNGAVKANIASKENAIGYMSLGMLDNTVKAVKVGGVEATTQNVKDKKYIISRPFLLLSKGDPSKAEVKAFLEFILSSEGQKIVAKEYIPVK